MADILFESPSGITRRFKDMGDGTHAEVMSSSASGAVPGESAITPTQGILTNRSGTIVAAGVAQQLAAANPARLGFSVQNLSAADLWVNSLGAATAAQPSIKIIPGAYFETPPGYGAVGAISIVGSSAGQTFSAREW